MVNYLRILGAISITTLLSACGGGGGGSTASAPVASTDIFQLQVANANMVQRTSTLNCTLSGTYNGYPISGNEVVTFGSLTSTTFENQPALSQINTNTGSFTLNGTQYPINGSSTNYYDTNYLPVGYYGTEYVVMNGVAVIPATIKINDSGTIGTATRYTDSTKTTLIGTKTVTWTLLPDTASTGILSVTDTYKDTTSTVTETDTSTYRLTPAGGVTNLTSTATYSNGNVLTLTY